jgi:hypothetical protein
MQYWLTQLLVSVYLIPDCGHPSLVILIIVHKVLGKIVRSGLHDRRLELILPTNSIFIIHILAFTTSVYMLVNVIREHVLVRNQNRRRNLLVQVELTHDFIWIVILNYPEVNHPHTTHSPVIWKKY